MRIRPQSRNINAVNAINPDFETITGAWVAFDGSGSSILDSYNISSITFNAAGDYTINLTTAMKDANYSLTGWVTDTVAAAGQWWWGNPTTTPTSSVFRVLTNATGGTNLNHCTFAISGRQF